MQKKLLAAAVAGALALPGAALAASSVTITGYFHVSYASIKVKPQAAGDSSQDRVQDESSRVYFRVVEDLGGGLQAIGQIDWRVPIDTGASGAGGANWVGLRSKSWGTLTAGRHDLHYIYTEDQSYSRGGSLKMVNTSIIAFSNAGRVAIANATRTPNTVVWDSPNWKGFTVKVAYSANPYGTEGEIGSSASGGYAWNLAPQYNAKNWGIGYSYWKGRNDGTGFAVTTSLSCTGVAAPVAACVGPGTVITVPAGTGQIKTRGDRINAHYQWGGLRIGLVWDRAKTDLTLVAPAISPGQVSKRDAWSLPIRYSWGKHNVFGHYSEAKKDKAALYSGLNTKAKMFAIGYSYELSKRTIAAF